MSFLGKIKRRMIFQIAAVYTMVARLSVEERKCERYFRLR